MQIWIRNLFDPESGMEKFGTWIRDKHRGSATLQKLYVFFNLLLLTVSCSGDFLHERVLLPVLPGLARTARCQVRYRLQEGGYQLLALKGLSHEIDFKKVDIPAATLT